MAMSAVEFLAGFGLLLGGANFLVRGAAALARLSGVPTAIIGLTIYAFGTSAPELMTNVFAGLAAEDAVVFGNIIGSDIYNLFFVLGICAVAAPLTVRTAMVRRQIPFCLAVLLVLFVLVNDTLTLQAEDDNLSPFDGGVLLLGGLQAFLLLILFYALARQAYGGSSFAARLPDLCSPFGASQAEEEREEDAELAPAAGGVGRHLASAAVGLAALVAGGWLVVRGCPGTAQALGTSQRVLSLTLVAAGTSVPELLVTWWAARTGRTDLAVANIIGSNVFNVVGILGVNGFIRRTAYDPALNADLAFLAAGTLALAVLVRRRHPFGPRQGGCFLALYGLYLVFVLWRG